MVRIGDLLCNVNGKISMVVYVGGLEDRVLVMFQELE